MKRKFVAIQPGLKCWLYNAVPACGARKQLKPLSTTDNSHLPRELPWTQMPEHAGFLHTGCMTGHWEPSANEKLWHAYCATDFKAGRKMAVFHSLSPVIGVLLAEHSHQSMHQYGRQIVDPTCAKI